MAYVNSYIVQNLLNPIDGTPCIVTKPPGINPCGVDVGGINQWNYSTNTNCFPGYTAYQCSQPTYCPALSNGENLGQYVTNYDQFNSQSQGRVMNCQYGIELFKDYNNVVIWINSFDIGAEPNTNSYNQILTEFCGQEAPAGTCPVFENTPVGSTACPNGLTGCSMFSSGSSGGVLCRNWANSTVGSAPAGYYQAGANFCDANICASDCLCYQRLNVDPVYDAVRNSLYIGQTGPVFPIQDKCWYTACLNAPDIYLQPNDMTAQSGSCPNVCLQILEIINSQDIEVDIANQTIYCNFAATGGSTGSNPSNPSSLWDTMGVYAAIFGFVLLIIIIIIICVVIATYEKK